MNKRDLKQFLEEVCAVIREKGWVSKTKRGSGKATVDHVVSPESAVLVLPVDAELANYAITWIRGLDTTGATDYIKTLKIICNKDEIAEPDFGYAASLIKAYQNSQEQAIKGNSQHVGNVDEEVVVKVRVLSISPTKYGYMYKLADAGGNLFTIFHKETSYGVVGDVFKLTGIIKEHRTFKGVLTTVVKRAYREELKKETPSVVSNAADIVNTN